MEILHDATQPADVGDPSTVPALPIAPARVRSRPSGRLLRVAIAVPVVCLALVLVLRLWVQYAGPLPGDRWAMTRNDFGGQPRSLLDIGNFFQIAGTPVVSIITILWAAVFVRRFEGTRGLVFLGLSATGVIFNALLKQLSGATPLMQHSPGALNFPSGHVVYGVVVFGSLAVMAWRSRRLDIAAALLFFAAFMGPFRVTIGAHLVSDVVAAYLVGIAWLVPVAILVGYGSASIEPRGS